MISTKPVHANARVLTLLLLLGLANFTWCNFMPNQTNYLVFDTEYNSTKTLPLSYRRAINSSASGQFNKSMVPKMFRDIKSPIIVIDLRQESHGFINGLAISWFKSKNEANKGMNRAQIKQNEDRFLLDVSEKKDIIIHEIVEKQHGKINKAREHFVKIENVETELEMLKNFNIGYERLFVLDHHVPNDVEVEYFLNFVNNLPDPKPWLHFHCRKGRGRATMFMVMYDIMVMSSSMSLQEIVDLNEKIGGKNIFDMPSSPNKMWKKELFMQRNAFLTDFYKYVNESKAYKNLTWAKWKQNIKNLNS